MEVSNYIVSKLAYKLLKGLITYLYWGYNPVTKYHGHPSTIRSMGHQVVLTFVGQSTASRRHPKSH